MVKDIDLRFHAVAKGEVETALIRGPIPSVDPASTQRTPSNAISILLARPGIFDGETLLLLLVIAFER